MNVYLQTLFQSLVETSKDHSHLFLDGYICLPSLQEDSSTFHKLRHRLKIDLEPTTFLHLLLF